MLGGESLFPELALGAMDSPAQSPESINVVATSLPIVNNIGTTGCLGQEK